MASGEVNLLALHRDRTKTEPSAMKRTKSLLPSESGSPSNVKRQTTLLTQLTKQYL